MAAGGGGAEDWASPEGACPEQVRRPAGCDRREYELTAMEAREADRGAH